jgi:hypothetical protein
MATTASTARRAPSGIEFYDENDALDLVGSGTMSIPEIADAAVSLEDLAELAVGQTVKVLFRSDEHGSSLVWSWFGPNYIVTRHSHSADCTYYIIRGEAHLGNRVVKAGSGFFVPADAPYGYTVGSEGLEILEFRDEPSFDMKVSEKAGRMAKILENSREHSEAWLAPAPE